MATGRKQGHKGCINTLPVYAPLCLLMFRDTHKMVCAGVCAAMFADVSNKNGMRWGVRRVYLYMFSAILFGYALGSAPLHVLYIRACDTLNFATSHTFALPRFRPAAI